MQLLRTMICNEVLYEIPKSKILARQWRMFQNEHSSTRQLGDRANGGEEKLRPERCSGYFRKS